MPVSIDREAEPPPMQADHSTRREDGVSTSRRATPLARRLARERGIDILALEGSGPKGRVQGADVERARIENEGAAAIPGRAARAKASRAPLHCQWLRQGEGAPLILIHGFGADLNAWRFFSPPRGSAHRCSASICRAMADRPLGACRASTRWSPRSPKRFTPKARRASSRRPFPRRRRRGGAQPARARASALSLPYCTRRAWPGDQRRLHLGFSAREERCRTGALRRRAHE